MKPNKVRRPADLVPIVVIAIVSGWGGQSAGPGSA